MKTSNLQINIKRDQIQHTVQTIRLCIHIYGRTKKQDYCIGELRVTKTKTQFYTCNAYMYFFGIKCFLRLFC